MPSVLVVLVVKDGARWLRECLLSLSRQTHPRIGVVAVDNGSSDGSRDILVKALGPERVILLEDNRGFPGAVGAALGLEVAARADYLLFLHDDTALDPEAISRMVEAAERIDGVGVVGPKVVDWDDPRVLREVGLSTDRFGYPYSPLEEGEIDQGQYDRIREVLFVSSCAMLVSRAAWGRAGLLDERLAARFEDLDFCWRARLAGFRVLMSPLALARHRGASARGERLGGPVAVRSRHHAERAALAAMLKNYGILSLLWVLPLYVAQGVGKVALLAVSRRFEDMTQVLEAWGWNLLRLPGTLRRRVRAQSVRAVPDRAVRRYMAPATIRLRRRLEIAGQIVMGRGRRPEAEEEEEAAAPLPVRARAAAMARDHPVGVAWLLMALVGTLAFRHLYGPEPVQGGVIPVFPPDPEAFFRELVSGVRTTDLGGAQAASPALGFLGGLSTVLFGSTALALKALLVGLPVLAGVTFHRVMHRRTGQKGAAVVAAGCYALSAASLWAFSEGRIGVLVLLVVLPPLSERLSLSFGDRPIPARWRFVVGTGIVLAVGAAFLPGAALAFGLLLAVHLLVGGAGGHRARGVAVALGAAAVAASLLFPAVIDLVRGSGEGLRSTVGLPDFASLARLAPAPFPASWSVSWFLPAAAVLSFGLVEGVSVRPAFRHLLVGAGALFLAWGAAAGHLPAAASNPPAYLAVAALAYCSLVALGLASVLPGMERRAFGYRQLAVVALGSLLAGGLVLQAVQAARGDWETGPGRLPPAWPVIASADPGTAYRVLWVGRPEGVPLPTPGGDPDGMLEAGRASLRYALTGRGGVSALDVGRADGGEGYGYLERAMAEVLSGTTRHGGALLSPLAVRFVVAAEGDLPDQARERLDLQLDLDRVAAGGLVIYRNAAALPQASVIATPRFASAAKSDDPLALAQLPEADPTRPEVVEIRRLPGRFGQSPGASVERYVLLAEQHASGWRMRVEGREAEPERAFGWANGFRLAPSAEPVTLRYTEQWVRTAETAGLAVLWLLALWVTRKPAGRAPWTRSGGRILAETDGSGAP